MCAGVCGVSGECVCVCVRVHVHVCVCVYSGMRVLVLGVIAALCREHKQTFGTLKNVISGSKLVDWMVDVGDVTTRAEGVLLGQDMFGQGIIRHGGCDSHVRCRDTPTDRQAGSK